MSAPDARPTPQPTPTPSSREGRPRPDPGTGGRLLALAALLSLPAALLVPADAGAQDAADVDLARFGAMAARSIGPAGMSGRVADVEVVGDLDVIWVGSATGGVWKSTNGGLRFEPVFDDEPASSIGQIAVHPENPDIVWVGTGEANPRNSMGVGRGVWKSVDGGRSWASVGLEGSERISRILLHPDDPRVAYVAALGPAWSDGEERGVYRTTDGGETWERVLYENASTGAADMVMDPDNPEKLIVAMWDYRRWPWFFRSGGPGSGIHITYDGGESWTELGPGDGLPSGELGRTGLAIAPSSPEVVYALVEAERSELLRSDDGGHTWRTVNRERGVNPRPFYYADLRVDPTNENRIYRVAGRLDVSEDGGKSFETVVPSRIIHGDVHELWLSPDGKTLIQGNDGGVGISYDRGETWRFVSNLPLAQYYHINVDSTMPYHVLGGMQDNGSWSGPAYVRHEGGIRNYDFQRIGGGDGFDVVPDPTDDRYLYGMSQQGRLYRFDRVTGDRTYIRPVHPDPEVELRFNWNAGIALDPHDPGAVYFGSQFLHRTTSDGAAWETISPDLTTDDPEKQRQAESGGLTYDVTGAENFTTIVSIAPSPLEEGLIWVGTDDGKVQITRDGGETWTNVADRLDGVPEGSWIHHIEASKHAAGRAYAAIHDYQRGNEATYVYRTDDHGESWERIADGSMIDGFVRVVEEDPVAPGLLWAGSEYGLWVSVDGGESWRKWTHGVPTVPVHDLVTHPGEHDLVVGTHGRGAYVIDDLRPLRALAGGGAFAGETVHLFEPPPAYHHAEAEPLGYRSTGHAMFFGENRPFGARLSLWVGEDPPAEEATVEVVDAGGEVIRTFEEEVEAGLVRFTWKLEMDGVRGPDDDPDEPPPSGPAAPPGDYTVRVALGEATSEAPLAVRLDPREDELRREDFVAAAETALEVARMGVRVEEAVERIRETREAIDVVLERLEEDGVPEARADSLRERAASVKESLEALLDRIVGDRDAQGITDRSATLRSRIYSAYVGPAPGVPTENQRNAIRRAEAAIAEAMPEVERVFEEEVAPLRRAVEEAGLSLVPEEG